MGYSKLFNDIVVLNIGLGVMPYPNDNSMQYNML